MTVPTAELREEAPKAILTLCHDAIAVNTTAFISAGYDAAEHDDGSDDELLGGGPSGKGAPLWRRLLGRVRGKKRSAADPSQEEAQGGAAAQTSNADKFTGSKTETALLSWSETLGAPHYLQLREKDVEQHVQVWPFSSERKTMSTLVKIRRREDGKTVWRLYVKGAPENVLQGCRWIVDVDGAFQSQDQNDILNERSAASSVDSMADADEDEGVTPHEHHADIPQINLDHGSDSEDAVGISPESSRSPYLLSAHYTGSHNIGSDTTDVGDDAPVAAGFPADFAHNPVIPVLPLDEETLQDLRRTVSDYASRALRTIGMAYRDFDDFDEAQLAQL
ncbi:plasma membrane calcium, partial [Coemansia guatemalensis]